MSFVLTRNCSLGSLPSPMDNKDLGDLDRTTIALVPTVNGMELSAGHRKGSIKEQGMND